MKKAILLLVVFGLACALWAARALDHRICREIMRTQPIIGNRLQKGKDVCRLTACISLLMEPECFHKLT